MFFQYTKGMEAQLRETLRTLSTVFAQASDCALSTVSRRCRNDSGFFHRLADPSKSFTVRTFDEVMQWFSDNWPTHAAWPATISRPAGANGPSTASLDSTADRDAESSQRPKPETELLPPADRCPGADAREVSRGVSSSSEHPFAEPERSGAE